VLVAILPHALPTGPRLAVSMSRWMQPIVSFFISRNQLGAHCVSVYQLTLSPSGEEFLECYRVGRVVLSGSSRA
jgi:hypothetical protein